MAQARPVEVAAPEVLEGAAIEVAVWAGAAVVAAAVGAAVAPAAAVDAATEGASRQTIALADAVVVATPVVRPRPSCHRFPAEEGGPRLRAHQLLEEDVDARARRRTTLSVELLLVATRAARPRLHVVAAVVQGRAATAAEEAEVAAVPGVRPGLPGAAQVDARVPTLVVPVGARLAAPPLS